MLHVADLGMKDEQDMLWKVTGFLQFFKVKSKSL